MANLHKLINMKISKATLTFIYSFLPIIDEMTYDPNILKMFVESKIADKKNEGTKPSGEGKIINRRGLSSYLALNIEMGYDIDYEFKAFLSNDPSIKLTIQPLFRFYTFGCSLTFHVTCFRENGLINHEDVYKVLQIISTEENNNASQTFILDDEIINNRTHEYSLYKFFKYRLKEKIERVNRENNVDIKLLCLSENIITESSLYESSVPWVITTIETEDKDILDSVCFSSNDFKRSEAVHEKLNRIAKYEKFIAPLLYRAIDQNFDSYKIEPSYDSFSLDPISTGLYNMYIDARFYLHMSRRSIFTLCNSLNEKPASYLLPTLFDINEICHTRWQSLIVLNMILDKYIRKFSNHVIDTFTPKEKLTIIIKLMKKTLAGLDDPMSYVISGDSLREFYERLVESYKLKIIEDNAIKKVNMLNSLYRLGLELDISDLY